MAELKWTLQFEDVTFKIPKKPVPKIDYKYYVKKSAKRAWHIINY